MATKFEKEAIVVETDGTQPIIIKRTDIKSNTKQFHKASILANTVSQKNQDIDGMLVEELANEFCFYLNEVFYEIKDDREREDENAKSQELDNQIYLNVKMESEKDAEKLFNELQNKGYECKIIS